MLRHESGLQKFKRAPDVASLTTEGIKKNEVGQCIEESYIEYPYDIWPEQFPGEKRMYHAIHRGTVVNEIFRRVDPSGRTFDEAMRESVLPVIGTKDIYIAMKDEEIPAS